jgi:polar amino acid transport system substrate-binding protein
VEEPSRVVLTVRDEGSGISEENLADCIKLFVTTKAHGTGFGLPFAKKVIESEHFGRLVLSSALGEGTTVTITLPKDQEKPGGEP